MKCNLFKWAAALTISLCLAITGCSAASPKQKETADSAKINTAEQDIKNSSNSKEIRFTDDDGREIVLSAPCKRIISFYSPHTENLFSLGAGNNVIGISDSVSYPPEAVELPVFDYNSDPEKTLAAEPDLVLIRPRITRKAPDFVQALEQAGIPVVSLYPDEFKDFDSYIHTLGMLVGKEEEAEKHLAAFHKELEAIAQKTGSIAEKKSVFFESTKTNCRTVTLDSLPAIAIALAGGSNIAGDAPPMTADSSIASFGEEQLFALADAIDVYIVQQGAMNAGDSPEAIAARPGFDTIKAIQEGQVYVIDEGIISAPSFRFVDGVKEIVSFLYPDLQLD